MLHLLGRIVLAAIGLIGAFGLFCVAYALTHMRTWEWPYLYPILGIRGLLFVVFLLCGLVLFTWYCLRRAFPARESARSSPVWLKAVLIVWAVAIVWVGEWSYVENPPTVALRDRLIGNADERRAVARAMSRFTADGSLAAIKALLPNVDERRLAIMFARVAVNRPSVFDHVSIGKIIAADSRKYHVSPVLLLDWNYIDSIYGKSPSGPVPFCAEMNVQLFRHLVQVHLPPWLIESRFRIAMVNGTLLTRLAGKQLGTKLRYGAQKATYDIAITPYMTNVMSDLLLVMQEYPQEFPELIGPNAPPSPLAAAFRALNGKALLKPYSRPYTIAPRDAAYYDHYRDDLISFARAAVYRLSSDFAFATKVQSLVARYDMAQYSERLGSERWGAVSERQQTALLAMLRDVYTPNIGHLSYNLYMAPELNDTPISYVAEEAAQHYAAVSDPARTWLPPEPERLWGATASMLRVLSEVWDVTTGAPLAGVHPTETMDSSVKVLVRNHHW